MGSEWRRLGPVLQRLRSGEMPLQALPSVVLELRRLLKQPRRDGREAIKRSSRPTPPA